MLEWGNGEAMSWLIIVRHALLTPKPPCSAPLRYHAGPFRFFQSIGVGGLQRLVLASARVGVRVFMRHVPRGSPR